MGLIRWVVNWYRDRCRKTRNNFGRAMGWGGCHCCGNTYDWEPNHHNTMFSVSRGCHPLCEECWSKLSIEGRKPFYHQLVDEWIAGLETDPFYRVWTAHQKQNRMKKFESDRLLIIAAVEAGK